MPILATYMAAKALRDHLQRLGVKFKPETLCMKTSGIYIPRYLKDTGIPYEVQDDGSVKWYFFYRFENGRPDMNVGECMLLAQINGIHWLAEKINNWHHNNH
jgi:hypothetical protein